MYEVSEGDAAVQVCVIQASGVLSQPQSMMLSTANGTANSGKIIRQ